MEMKRSRSPKGNQGNSFLCWSHYDTESLTRVYQTYFVIQDRFFIFVNEINVLLGKFRENLFLTVEGFEDELEDGEEAAQGDLELKAETGFKGRFSFSFTSSSCRTSPSTSQKLTLTRSPPCV